MVKWKGDFAGNFQKSPLQRSITRSEICNIKLVAGLACLFHKGIQKGSKFNSSPVYCSLLYGVRRLGLFCLVYTVSIFYRHH